MNKLIWHHIMDKQPKHNQMIVQCDPPYHGHHCMGMRKYSIGISFKKFIKWCEERDVPKPNFWWMAAKDFPFPKRKKGKQ